MLRKCHGHGLTKGVIIQIFYHGLDEPTQAILDVTAGGIFLYKSPNQAFQLLEDKVLFNHDWPIKAKNEHHQKSVAFADGSNSNNDKFRLMEKLASLTVKMDSQIISLNEELQDIRNKYNELKEGNASKNNMNDDTPMCERHEVSYIQSEGYQNRNSYDSFSHQSLHDPNDSEKSLTELNNDVRNDLEDFKRRIRSMRTIHWKLYDSDDRKTTGVLPNKKSKPINQEPQSKTDFEKLMTKFLDGQRVTNMFFKNNVNDMILKIKQNEKNFKTKIKNMKRKIDEWSKSQNVSSKKIDRTDPPPPQAHTEHVNAVFTGSGKSDYSPKNLKDPPPSIIVNNKTEKDKPIKTSKRDYQVVKTNEYPFREYIPKIPYPQLLNMDHSHLNRIVKRLFGSLHRDCLCIVWRLSVRLPSSVEAQLVDTDTESDPEEAPSKAKESQPLGSRVPLMSVEFEASNPSGTRTVSSHSSVSSNSTAPLSPDHPLNHVLPTLTPTRVSFHCRTTHMASYRSSYETPSPSSSPTLPVRKIYKGTSELILDTDSEEDELGEEDTEEDDSSDADDERQAVSEPLGLGYGAAKRRALESTEEISPSTHEVGRALDPKDGRVYTDILTYIPLVAPVQTPPSLEWSLGSLQVSPSSPIVPSPIASPVATLAATISVDEDQFTEVGAQLEFHGGILQDHTQRLDALPPMLFEGYNRDLRELYTRSGAVRDEIFLHRYRFRSIKREQERATVTFSAIWRPILALEAWAGQTDAQRAALWHAIYDIQRENHDLRRQLAEERRERLELTDR
ncbi:hypothetical protein Tco_0508604 [Tanacetum coccineum]